MKITVIVKTIGKTEASIAAAAGDANRAINDMSEAEASVKVKTLSSISWGIEADEQLLMRLKKTIGEECAFVKPHGFRPPISGGKGRNILRPTQD